MMIVVIDGIGLLVAEIVQKMVGYRSQDDWNRYGLLCGLLRMKVLLQADVVSVCESVCPLGWLVGWLYPCDQ
jgi:hypothetical protein